MNHHEHTCDMGTTKRPRNPMSGHRKMPRSDLRMEMRMEPRRYFKAQQKQQEFKSQRIGMRMHDTMRTFKGSLSFLAIFLYVESELRIG
jgi:uncharacterized membrane protein